MRTKKITLELSLETVCKLKALSAVNNQTLSDQVNHLILNEFNNPSFQDEEILMNNLNKEYLNQMKRK